MPAFSVPENLAFSDYNSLVSGIGDWLDRTDLTGAAPMMIALAESRMRRALDPLFTETVADLTTVDGIVDLPSDYGTFKRAEYNYYTMPRWSGFSSASLASTDYSTDPYSYSIEADKIRLWPPVSVTFKLWYQPTLPQLSVANPTNAVFTKFPDMYFFGAMMFAEGYVANDNRAALFKGLFDEALGEVSTYLERQRYSGPLAPRIARA